VCGNPDVSREFRERFRVILVDEFQDTDPLQADLLLCLAGNEDGKVRTGRAVHRRRSEAIDSIDFAVPTSAPIGALPTSSAMPARPRSRYRRRFAVCRQSSIS
jgi:superfamily I DNA/RNA helicase